MIANLLKTTNRTVQIISLTILVKIFSYKLNITKTHFLQKSIANFLLNSPNKQRQITNIKSWLLNLQEDIPTKIWIRKEDTFTSILGENCTSNFKQYEYKSIQCDYSPINRFLLESLTFVEQEIIDTFIQRINNPTSLHVELINNASRSKERTITVVSSFAISKYKSKQLIIAIREKIAASGKIKFQIKSNITNKIELRDWGYKISWNLKHYITELETNR